jgi:3-dehydroquinate synthase
VDLLKRKVCSRSGDYFIYSAKRLVTGFTRVKKPSITDEMDLLLLREPVATHLKSLISSAPLVAVISQSNIMSLYQESMDSFLGSVNKSGGFALPSPNVKYYTVGEGEESKTLSTVEDLYTKLINDGITRDSLIIALGGGITGDIAGFVAATLLRGIKWVNIPTTLVAQVDSSIGGKTGVNHTKGRNLIGSFYPPEMVLVDPVFLSTLSKREFISGMGEVLKYGAGISREVYDLLVPVDDSFDVCGEGLIYDNWDYEELLRLIWFCLLAKADVVAEDEHEGGRRKILNIGHTIAHAMEGLKPGVFTHGEAVATGLIYACDLSLALGLCDKDFVATIRDMAKKLAQWSDKVHNISFSDLEPYIARDKKQSAKGLGWVLPVEPGKTIIKSGIDRSVIESVWDNLQQ